MRIERPAGIPDGNPLIVVGPQEVADWLRSLADAAGFADRASCVVQVKDSDGNVTLGSPELVLMVSNIANSRKS